MAPTYQQRVGLALDILNLGLAPFVSREFIARHKKSSRQVLERIFSKAHEREQIFGRGKDPNKPFHYMDIAMLLRVMWNSWHEAFGVTLGHAERSLASELRGFRNEWAHWHPLPAPTPTTCSTPRTSA